MKFIEQEKHKNNIGIYIITNLINGRRYVGKTEDRFIERFWNHTWKLDNKKHDNKHLERAWHKYGKENFEFRVEKVCSHEDDVSQIEIDTIEKYDTYNNGYNKTIGGDGTKGNYMSEEAKLIVGKKNRIHNLGKKHSEETKKKMSEVHKGYVKTKEHRENLSKALKGKIISEETKEKLRKLNTGINSPVTKFSEKDVVEIKTMLVNKVPQKIISSKFNTSMGTISAIANERTWKHIEVEGWNEYVASKVKKRKLTIEEVKQIKKILQVEKPNCSEIARMYGVAPSTINDIKNNKSFPNIIPD